MELTVNYSYIEQIIPPRCRNPRPTRFDDGVAVLSIREVTSEQAPVAIIGSEKDYQSDDYLEPVVYRWFEGRLWTNCAVSSCSRRRATNYPAIGPTLNLVKDSAVLSDTALGIYVCAREGRQGIADYLQACTRDWLIIDGQLHRPAGEPMYLVMTFGLGGNHGGTALMTDDFLNPNIRVAAYFSLLELEQATEYALKIASERGDTEKVSTESGYKFELLIHEVIKWKNPALQADDTAQAAVLPPSKTQPETDMNTTDLEQRYAAAIAEIAAQGLASARDLTSLQELVKVIKDTVDDEQLSFPDFEQFFAWWDVTTAYDQMDEETCAEYHKPALAIAYEALVSEGFF